MVGSMLGACPKGRRLDGSLAIEHHDCEVTLALTDQIYNENNMLVVGALPWGSAQLYPSLSPNPVTFRDLVWVTVVEGGGVNQRRGCMGP